MPIYVTTSLDASRNPFITALYHYRRCKIEAKAISASSLDDARKKRFCSKLLKESLMHYQSALNYALTTGAQESKDFLIWLHGNKPQIISDFDYFAKSFSTFDLPHESNLAQEQSRTYLDKINQRFMKYPTDLQQKMHEIDRIATNEKLLKKPAVRKVYCNQFSEFLMRIREYPMWYFDPSNQAWLKLRYTMARECSLNKNEDELEWKEGIRFLKLEVNKYDVLDKLVGDSIDLCFQWHEKSQLEKLKESLNRLLTKIEEGFLDQLKEIKSVGKRVLKFLKGVIRVMTSPITVPVLFGYGGISGNLGPLRRLTTAIKKDCEDLWEQMKKNPWLSFFAIMGLIGSSAFPLVHVIWGSVGLVGAFFVNELSVATHLKKTDERALNGQKMKQSLVVAQTYESIIEDEKREWSVLRDNNRHMEAKEKIQRDEYGDKYKRWCKRKTDLDGEIFLMMNVQDRQEARQEVEEKTVEVKHQEHRLHIQQETVLMRIRHSIDKLDHIEEKQQRLYAVQTNTKNVVIVPPESFGRAGFFNPLVERKLLTFVQDVELKEISLFNQRRENLIEKINKALALSIPERDTKRLINLLNEREESELLLELVSLVQDEKKMKKTASDLTF